MGISAEEIKQVMRNWCSGVAIVTSSYENIIHGMTINSFTSVSIDPPLVTVTLANNTRTYEFVKKTNEFGITILSSRQKELSDRFAGKISDWEHRFDGVDVFTMSGPSPMISGGVAWMSCKVINEINLGSSSLFIAEVTDTQIGSGEPLLYHYQSYYYLGNKVK